MGRVIKLAFVIFFIPSICFGWGVFPMQMGSTEAASGSAGYTGYTIGDSGYTRIDTEANGQSFQVPSSGTLDTIEIYIGDAFTGGDVYMRVSSSSDLDTGYLEEVIVAISDTDDNSWITFSFTNGDILTASTTYYFGVIDTTGLSNLRLRFDAEDSTYANGAKYSQAGGSNNWELFTETTGADLLFMVNNP